MPSAGADCGVYDRVESPVGVGGVEACRVEVGAFLDAQPLQQVVMLGVVGVGERVDELLVAGSAAGVLRWAGACAVQTGWVSAARLGWDQFLQQDLVFLLRVHSEDVIHAFYVPDLGIKIDVVPGTTNIFWVQATIPGTYTVQCAEFCGVGHSQMHGEVVVFPPGTQTIPYGPPPSAVQPGFGTAKYTIVDVAFKEHPGPCLPGSQWSLEPCRISLGSNFNVTFRVWNNESGTHQFELGSPISLVGPIQDTSTAAQPAYFNFNTGNPGQYSFWYACQVVKSLSRATG